MWTVSSEKLEYIVDDIPADLPLHLNSKNMNNGIYDHLSLI